MSVEEIHLVITDVLMPFPNGTHIIDSIKGGPVTAHIPVIVITALDHSDIPEFNYKVEDILVKPFTAEQLINKVNSYKLVK